MNSSCQRIHEVIHASAAGMTAEQLEWHREGKWSAAEIIEHLALTYSGSKIGMDRCTDGDKPSARTPTAKDRLSTFLVVTLVSPLLHEWPGTQWLLIGAAWWGAMCFPGLSMYREKLRRERDEVAARIL